MGADPATVDIDVESGRVALRFAGTPYEDHSTDLGDDVLVGLETLRRDAGPAEYGAQLIQSIVRGNVAAGFQEAIATIKGGRQSLRLRLRIGEDPRLSGIWWEGLFDKTIPGGWASINRGTPVSRYQPRDPQWMQSPCRSSELKVLAVISNPRDLGQPGQWVDIPSLDEDIETRTLTQALSDLDRVKCNALTNPASPGAMRKALLDGPRGADSPGFHVLHLVAPAFLDPKDGRAFLLLEENDQSARVFGEDDLLQLVSGMPDLQFVILAGAHSVPAADGAALVRLASRLVDFGVPAALAIRDRLQVDPASAFLARLYTLVEKSLRKTDWIDSVVNEARNGLHWEVGKERWTWLLPVLYMRGDGRLFNALDEPDSSPGVGSIGKAAPAPDHRGAASAYEGTTPGPAPSAPWSGAPAGGTAIYLNVSATGSKEADMRRIDISGGKNVIGMDSAHFENVTQADDITYNAADMNKLLDVLIATLRANTAADPTVGPAAAQLEAAKAQVAAGDPPEAIKSRLENAGQILAGADETVKKGLNLAETLGKAAGMVKAVIPWVTAALAIL